MISSMKSSDRAVCQMGIPTAVSLALTNATVAGSNLGGGVEGWSGLLKSPGSQEERESSFERSVTISDKAHQVGGLGAPPKERRSAKYATSSKTMMLCAAAFPEC